MKLYIIGSLRNPEVPKVAEFCRQFPGIDVFDDWYAAGPTADDSWKEYEVARGRDYQQALDGHVAKHVFAFDKKHLDEADAVLMVLPAGKSGHLEFGYAIGQGKLGWILLQDNYATDADRWDVMYQFATKVVSCEEELSWELKDWTKGLI